MQHAHKESFALTKTDSAKSQALTINPPHNISTPAPPYPIRFRAGKSQTELYPYPDRYRIYLFPPAGTAAKTPAKRDVDQKTAGLSCDRQPMRPSFLRQNESEQQRPIAIHAS